MTHDNTTFYSGEQSQRIEIVADGGVFHGIRQDGVDVAAGVSYRVRLSR
jgi:hypothetical protein